MICISMLRIYWLPGHAGSASLVAISGLTIRRTLLVISAIASALAGSAVAAGSVLEWRALSESPNDHTCQAVPFEQPQGLAIDHDGNIYVGNEGGAKALQKISTGGVITTLLDRGPKKPDGLAYGKLSLALRPNGRIVLGVGARGTIEELEQVAGAVPKVLAGQPGKFGLTDGPASQATFKTIRAVAMGPHGDVYIADSRTIRKLSADGVVSTLAGDEHAKKDYADGKSGAAAFGEPRGLAIDDLGNVYVADGSWRIGEEGHGSSFGLLRKIDPLGVVTSIAGDMDADGAQLDGRGTGASFTELFGMAGRPDHALYVTEAAYINRFAIRRISAALDVTTILDAGDLADFEKDRDGSDPAFYRSTGIAIDPNGTVYLTDAGGNKLHRIEKQLQEMQQNPQRHSDEYVTTLCSIANSSTRD